MTIQNLAFTIALAGMGVVAIAFLHIVRQASRPADEDATDRAGRTAHALRRWLFIGFLAACVGGTWATLHPYPIPRQRATGEAHQSVEVVGRQWSWLITPDTLVAGRPVEFAVTSTDVNHGFAIYNPSGRIVTQTQAMPGYTNRIVHTFDQPGRYEVMCLEYCGLGHAPMTSHLTVVPPPEGR